MSQLNISDGGYVASGSRPEVGVVIQFKDGLHGIPPAIVQHLGGADLLLQTASKFSKTTYKQFLDGFWMLVERDLVRTHLNSVINDHLATYGKP
jgi:hypothetical protein